MKLGLSKIACIFAFCTMVSIALPAKTTLKTLARLWAPDGPLIQGTDGNFYGTTWSSGSNNAGTVFRITPEGKLTTLYSFCSLKDCIDGAYANGGLVQAANGEFYGTTNSGGAHYCGESQGGCGTIFKITPGGKLTTLHNFCSQRNCRDGSSPYAGLAQGKDGNFYGTTFIQGGGDRGTVFRITPAGKLTTLYNFCSLKACSDGESPIGRLVQAADGDFYGTTYTGGDKANYAGTVFKITPTGKLTTLYSFAGYPTEGGYPQAALVQASDGNFYGTTYLGGSSGDCSYFGCGTVFKITPTGKLTTLHNFCAQTNCTDGATPIAALVQATDGSLYGTTVAGGIDFGGGIWECNLYENYGCGTIFRITGAGKLTTLYSFCSLVNCADGANPVDGLLQATNGTFYGTTDDRINGTVFSLTVGRGPFAEMRPASGKVGTKVVIPGN